jgi:diaminohydroxyphosphoribosylaminopyrimidine deaminase/5-amino-6-(5-phosphoribosylamino)uracil reductase
MSSKKDKSKYLYKYFMSIAMNLAKDRVGLTGLNPSVGCLIVKNNKILSFGQTGFKGRPHAEYVAIKKCTKKQLNGSTIFVTMEPCTHFGKTPPCANLIIKSKIKNVIYSINDVDKRTSRKAYSYLKSKKINVLRGLLKVDAQRIYKKYFDQKIFKKPFVAAKIACSNDFFMSSNNKFITNKYSRDVSHILRYNFDSILISSKTANADKSKLSCRINGLENFSPKRLILDKNLKINRKSPIITDKNKHNTIIFHSTKNKKKLRYFKSKGIKLSFTDLDSNNNIDLKKVFLKAYNFGIGSIIIEGGKTLTKSILKDKLINEFYLFKSKNKLGNLGKNKFSSFKKIINFLKRKENIETFLDGDKIIRYY